MHIALAPPVAPKTLLWRRLCRGRSATMSWTAMLSAKARCRNAQDAQGAASNGSAQSQNGRALQEDGSTPYQHTLPAGSQQEGRFEEAALLRARQVELVEALTAAVDAGPRLPRVRCAHSSRSTLQLPLFAQDLLPQCLTTKFNCLTCAYVWASQQSMRQQEKVQ